MLIDEMMPRYDVAEYHQRRVRAAPERVYAAIRQADLAAAPAVKALLALRMAPARLARRERPAGPGWRVRLQDVLDSGFVLLAEDPGRELVIGVSGCFWKLTGNLSPTDPRRFREAPPAGTARAAWNFVVAPQPDGGGLLSTETRVLCADPAALRSFRRYWAIVGPFSSLIRRAMLRSIAAVAQRPEAPPR